MPFLLTSTVAVLPGKAVTLPFNLAARLLGAPRRIHNRSSSNRSARPCPSRPSKRTLPLADRERTESQESPRVAFRTRFGLPAPVFADRVPPAPVFADRVSALVP